MSLLLPGSFASLSLSLLTESVLGCRRRKYPVFGQIARLAPPVQLVSLVLITLFIVGQSRTSPGACFLQKTSLVVLLLPGAGFEPRREPAACVKLLWSSLSFDGNRKIPRPCGSICEGDRKIFKPCGPICEKDKKILRSRGSTDERDKKILKSCGYIYERAVPFSKGIGEFLNLAIPLAKESREPPGPAVPLAIEYFPLETDPPRPIAVIAVLLTWCWYPSPGKGSGNIAKTRLPRSILTMKL
ncbi:hypothetical protein MBM_03469 [Drepanopeziza brunnea f. sp. 'multigermtubi' MB_m1]|uniref:Uncharacterized protein n=1 Tax=Marssonina brunnea f. sp. multigermtubi (strain MB_m1) TaxID=1072389 RepID=K1WZQ4_MARBU|nr:uncharacterized protein MBM_03469 [Drepanopeziza brunnea f. sp. 'multigermtubi' MB_m1]EKD18476.1 hypothetical protein MBM_03469 [Drepanopeziza brunnea f. sp. 'multigermtubi' MB_m1]